MQRFLLSFPWAWRLSRDVLVDVRFVYDKAAVIGKAMKDAPCICKWCCYESKMYVTFSRRPALGNVTTCKLVVFGVTYCLQVVCALNKCLYTLSKLQGVTSQNTECYMIFCPLQGLSFGKLWTCFGSQSDKPYGKSDVHEDCSFRIHAAACCGV